MFDCRGAWRPLVFSSLLACSLLAMLVEGASAQQAPPAGGFRKLAPGIETTIPPELQQNETFAKHPIVELRALGDLPWQPNYTAETQTLYEMAAEVNFRRTITCLQFTFKPLRMIEVDLPQPSGKMQRKLIWYMVYRVKNLGVSMAPVRKEDGSYTVQKVSPEIPFQPQFVLESHEYKEGSRKKAYLDRVIPAAMGPIQMREDKNRPLLNSVDMAIKPIPVSDERVDRSVWGVATWEDIDPRLDFFSIYVGGLSNAYKFEDPPGVYKAGDPLGTGRRFVYKTLQLNFWRPGDTEYLHEEEIRYGTPPTIDPELTQKLYGVKPGVEYSWVYR